MTAHYQIAQYQPRTRGNQKDWQGDSKQRITLRSTPKLCQPFIGQNDEFHYLLIHEGIKVHLSYNQLDELWTGRFSWIEDNEEVEAGFYPEIQTVQYPRDMPVADMLEALIEVIDNRWQNDELDWIKV